jgi:hypothetical protein
MEEMNKIVDIATDIRDRHLYDQGRINKAVARVIAICNGMRRKYWVAQEPVMEYDHNDGFLISKNSKVGAMFIQNMGSFKYNIYAYNILNRAIYNPFGNDISDIKIKFNGDGKDYYYANINQLLEIVRKLQEEQQKLEQSENEQNEIRTREIKENIKKIKEERDNLINKIQNFIRKGYEMRYQPILDPIQDKMRRENIFDDNILIINGGPGTGKTISLVQRIKFLISPTIEKKDDNDDEGYFKLGERQKNVLFGKKNNWIFFSPSELLKLFLRDTIVKEGLAANSQTVKVWETHKLSLITLYKINQQFFLPTSTDTFFGESLLINKPENIEKFIKEFEKYYIAKQKERFENCTKENIDSFKWNSNLTELGKKIQKSLTRDINSIISLLNLFVFLRNNYKEEIDNLTKELKDKVGNLSAKLQAQLQSNDQKYSKITELLNNNATEDAENGEEDEENIPTEKDNQIKLNRKLEKICKREGLRKRINIAEVEKGVLSLIEINNSEYSDELDAIGELAHFERIFKSLIFGSAENTILNEIPKVYREFRLDCYVNNNGNYHLDILLQVIDAGESRRKEVLHADEQAFLLYFINDFCYQFAKINRSQFEQANHSYINGYKNNCKPIIGIDEATDFSIIDLLSMHSLKNYDIHSVTLSGDILQNITDSGLKSWDDISNLSFLKTNKEDLNISYRQSHSLVELAKDMHHRITRQEANYKSYLEEDKDEPKPLICISCDEDVKLNWIANRIQEIYEKYQDAMGIIPSIAVFTQTEMEAENVAARLNGLLAELGVIVRYCRGGEVLGDSEAARVYCIDKIKGLEFEACFIHNFEELLKSENSDIALKHLYVGLSRAAFYLGLTSSEEFNEKLSFMNKHFDREGNWVDGE